LEKSPVGSYSKKDPTATENNDSSKSFVSSLVPVLIINYNTTVLNSVAGTSLKLTILKTSGHSIKKITKIFNKFGHSWKKKLCCGDKNKYLGICKHYLKVKNKKI
jgi:hypothetical protein